MHDPHDDLLERELARLSEYTGEPVQTPLWQQAIDAHRRERQQRLWVWIRRPAPALAAAGLAVMVASVALRSPVAADRGRGLVTGTFDTDKHVRLETVRDSSTKNAPPDPAALRIENGALRNLDGSVFYNARVNDRSNNEPTPPEFAQLYDLAGSPVPPAPAPSDGAPAEGGAGGRSPGAGTAARSAGGGAGASGVGGLALAGAAEPVGFKAEVGTDGHYRYVRGGISSVPEPSANLALTVPDLKVFYNQLPTLVDAKQGEQVVVQPPTGEEPASQTQEVNLTLRVKEDRLSAVVDTLKKTGRVQAQSGQTLAKETRLQQIDVLVEAEKQVVEKKEAASQHADKDAGRQAVEQEEQRKRVEALHRRRQQIEQGGELATINVVVVPEVAAPEPAPSTPLAAASGTPATDSLPPAPVAPPPAPSAALGAPTAFGTAPAKSAPLAPGTGGPADPAPAVAASPANHEAAPVDKAKKAETEHVEKLATKADITLMRKEAAVSKDAPGDSSTGGKTQAPAPSDARRPMPPADLAAPANSGTNEAPRPLSPAAPPTRAAPVPPGPEAAKPAGRAEAPASALPPVAGGKIQQAAREGWSTLGDTTATFVRGAIGTMLYWLPALVGLVVAIVWWRRRAAAAAQEPPPK